MYEIFLKFFDYILAVWGETACRNSTLPRAMREAERHAYGVLYAQQPLLDIWQ